MSTGRTPAELRAAVASQLAAGKSLAEVKSSFAGQQLGGSIVQDVAQNRGYIAPAPAAPRPTPAAAPAAPRPTPAAAPAAPWSPPPSSSSSSGSSSGRTTQEIKAAVASQVAAGKPLAEIKDSFAGQKLGGSAVQDIWNKTRASLPAATTTTTTPSTTTATTSSATDPFSSDVFGSSIPGGITEPEYTAAQRGAELQTQSQISNYGWDAQKAIAALQQAGATERTKYEVDNKIPLVQAEAQGKIDLQKIVNAGYKNIANIERGTEMVRNITSMFNF